MKLGDIAWPSFLESVAHTARGDRQGGERWHHNLFAQRAPLDDTAGTPEAFVPDRDLRYPVAAGAFVLTGCVLVSERVWFFSCDPLVEGKSETTTFGIVADVEEARGDNVCSYGERVSDIAFGETVSAGIGSVRLCRI